MAADETCRDVSPYLGLCEQGPETEECESTLSAASHHHGLRQTLAHFVVVYLTGTTQHESVLERRW